jgi:hypothetical protein
VSQAKRSTFLHVRRYALAKNLSVHLIRNQKGNDIRIPDDFFYGRYIDSLAFCSCPRSAPISQPNRHPEPTIAQVQRLSTPLAAVANYCNRFALEQGSITVNF